MLISSFSPWLSEPRGGSREGAASGPSTHASLYCRGGGPFPEALAYVLLHLLTELGPWTKSLAKRKGPSWTILQSQVHGHPNVMRSVEKGGINIGLLTSKVCHKHCAESPHMTSEYSFVRAAVIKCHRLGGLNNSNLFSHSSGGWKSKMSAGLVSSEASPLGM